ncbi:MAG: hypothetical protein NC397_02000 [Clostridium sp.]|nr:hypothetical protein [Clostridium sp.]
MGLFKKKTSTDKLTVKGVYISGLPSNFITKNIFCLILDEESGILQFKRALEDEQSVNLSLSKIKSLEIISEDEIKESNGVGRAIAGGLLFGPTGAVVGAVTAKDKKKKVYYEALNYISNGEEKSIIFQSGDLNYFKLKKILKAIIEQNDLQPKTIEL